MKYEDYFSDEIVIPKGTVLGSFFLIVVKGKLLLNDNTIPHLSCIGDKDFNMKVSK
jgi:hypothetical protein